MLELRALVDGKYRIVRELGRGGMGVVYEAAHEQIRRRVALKVLHPEVAASPDAVARFQQEARAAARIGSGHIADVLDLGTLPDGRPYLVMELLEGESLAARLARGTLPVDEACALTTSVLRGLEAAHAAGIVHRDLKPDNVFLVRGRSGRDWVKVLDFGISKCTVGGEVGPSTRAGIILGTPWYMAPEQARGRRDVDARADLYAVGVILYQSLTGHLPHPGEHPGEVLTAIALKAPPDPRRFRPDLDAALVQVLARVLAKDPAARPASARDLAAELAPWSANRAPTSSRPPPPSSRTRRASALTRRASLVGAVACALAAVAAVSAAVWSSPRAEVAVPADVALPAPSSASVEPLPSATPAEVPVEATPEASMPASKRSPRSRGPGRVFRDKL